MISAQGGTTAACEEARNDIRSQTDAVGPHDGRLEGSHLRWTETKDGREENNGRGPVGGRDDEGAGDDYYDGGGDSCLETGEHISRRIT